MISEPLLESFIARLLALHQMNVVAGTADPLEALHNQTTLALAQAALRQARLFMGDAAGLTTQVVIMGPTQAGKSSLVNRLLGAERAGVSALAGHTVHLHGFSQDAPDTAPLDALLTPLARVPVPELQRSELDHYTLEAVGSAVTTPPRRATLWDSPDFDSLESADYRTAVLLGLSLADVVVLALSKDKYADRTVWTVLELLHALDKPVLIVLNKLDPADQATLVHSIEQRHLNHFTSPAPPVHAIAFSRGGMPLDTDQALTNTLADVLGQVDRDRREAQAQAFSRYYWTRWTASLRLLLAARQHWQQQVAEAVTQADRHYAERYLHDHTHYDTFNRALLALLELLEIPGLAKVLGRTRQAVTWPVRQVFRWGATRVAGRIGGAGNSVNIEQQILDDIGAELVTRLQAEALDMAEQATETGRWWQSLHQSLRQHRAAMLAEYTQLALHGQAEFAPRIEAAADRLYARLQQQPAVLNTLRAARATTDAAGVALAVKSGGMPTADLVLAPAMLSLTSLLTESTLGRYLDKVRSELQAEQRRQRHEQLFEGFLAERLGQLGLQAGARTADQAEAQAVVPAPITAEQLARVEGQLFAGHTPRARTTRVAT